MLIELCKADRPLALFPVRLETRFFPQPNGSSELRVRVYPDRIHIDSHEAELTQAEKTWGQHYWTQIFLAGDDTQAQMNAWRQLADRYDPQRAAWIARLLRPTNLESRTASTEPSFPRVDVVEEGKDAAWRSAPKARLLPTAGSRSCKRLDASSPRLPAATSGRTSLSVRIRRSMQTPRPRFPATRRRSMPACAGWSTSTRRKRQAWGCAFRSAPRISPGRIDSLIVLGAATGATANEGAKQLGEQLDAQHYTDGLEFLRFGTPSNNTSAERSGYGAEDTGHERSFATESGAVDVTLDEQSNGQRLGTALGLPGADIAPVLASVGWR